MSFFKPKIVLLDTWQRTVSTLASTFQKQLFVIENSFVWQDFDPQVDASVFTSLTVDHARYIKFNNLCFLRFGLTVVIPGTPASISITLPVTTWADSTFGPRGSYPLNIGVLWETGVWGAAPSSNTLTFYRDNIAAFYPSTVSLSLNTILEVQ